MMLSVIESTGLVPVRRNAVVLVVISALSGFGSTAMALVSGVWIFDLTGSAGLAALAGLCLYAPTLAGPWLGGLLDRLPRRPLVVGVNLALAAALLGLLAVRAPAQAWLIFAVAIAYGVSYVLIDAGESALLPAALPAAALADVNGWRSSAQEGMKLLAPAAGAGLYAWQGGHAVAVLSAAMPILGAALYPVLRLHGPDQRTARPGQRGVRAGLAVLRSQPALAATVTLAAVSIAMSGFQTAATYRVVTADLALPASFLGVLGSAQGAGSILAGLVVGRIVARRGPVVVAVAGTVLVAASSLVRCVPWWPAAVGSAVIAGVGLPWTLIAAVTAVQQHTPHAVLGRVAATANTVMFAPVALAIPLGAAAVRFGSRPSLVAAAVTCAAAAALVARRRVPE
jgi:hypothetical protein